MIVRKRHLTWTFLLLIVVCIVLVMKEPPLASVQPITDGVSHFTDFFDVITSYKSMNTGRTHEKLSRSARSKVCSVYYNNNNKDEYLIQTSSCSIVRMDPFDPSVLIPENTTQVNCSSRPSLLTYVKPPEEFEDRWQLRLDTHALSQYVPFGHRLSCCYSTITRPRAFSRLPRDYSTSDMGFVESTCKPFNERVFLKEKDEFIKVKCYSYLNVPNYQRALAYINMHAMTPMKSYLKEALRKRTPEDYERLNVMIFITDSLSQLNLLRTMPNTVDYLKKADFINFWGYTKVGDNSFPNGLGILTGLNRSLAGKTCMPNTRGEIDACPFLWDEFKKDGYATAFLEDESLLCTFNHGAGFLKQPTDYYLRPYTIAAHGLLPIKKTATGLRMCLGPTSQTDHVLDYLSNFLFTFQNYFHFSLTWLSNFSHGSLNQPKHADRRISEFLNQLRETGILNNSLVLFMSDHGYRFGPILKTRQGWYESRMPYVYMSLPDWWKLNHPIEYKNILSNRNRLVSNYDIHVTIKDILSMGESGRAYPLKGSLACPKCRSLMSGDFGDRTCEDAGIPAYYCTCSKFEDIDLVEEVQGAVTYAVQKINLIVTPHKRCQKVHLTRINNASRKVTQTDGNYKVYLVAFETEPKDAAFEAAVRYDNYYSLEGDIHRINLYEPTSKCMKDPSLKPYCICR